MRYILTVEIETPGDAEYDAFGEDVIEERELTPIQKAAVKIGTTNGILSKMHDAGVSEVLFGQLKLERIQ